MKEKKKLFHPNHPNHEPQCMISCRCLPPPSPIMHHQLIHSSSPLPKLPHLLPSSFSYVSSCSFLFLHRLVFILPLSSSPIATSSFFLFLNRRLFFLRFILFILFILLLPPPPPPPLLSSPSSFSFLVQCTMCQYTSNRCMYRSGQGPIQYPVQNRNPCFYICVYFKDW